MLVSLEVDAYASCLHISVKNHACLYFSYTTCEHLTRLIHNRSGHDESQGRRLTSPKVTIERVNIARNCEGVRTRNIPNLLCRYTSVRINPARPEHPIRGIKGPDGGLDASGDPRCGTERVFCTGGCGTTGSLRDSGEVEVVVRVGSDIVVRVGKADDPAEEGVSTVPVRRVQGTDIEYVPTACANGHSERIFASSLCAELSKFVQGPSNEEAPPAGTSTDVSRLGDTRHGGLPSVEEMLLCMVEPGRLWR